MKILFVAPGDILKARVEPLMWVRMCEAFARIGIDTRLVSLYVRRPGNVPRKALRSYYGINHTKLHSTIIPTLLSDRSTDWMTNIWGLIVHFSYAFYMLIRRPGYDCVVTKKYSFLLPYLMLKKWIGLSRVILEIHAMPTNPRTHEIIRAVDGVVTNSETLKNDLVDLLDIPTSKVLVSYLAPHSTPESKPSAQRSPEKDLVAAAQGKPVVVYAGKLLDNEIDVILDAALRLTTDAHFVILGGNPNVLGSCRRKLSDRNINNVTFTGFVAPVKVDLYLRNADILLVNYDIRASGSHKYMTPGKVFDYMLIGKPMVTAHFEALEEILVDRENAFFFEPGNPVSLANCILGVLEQPELAADVASAAMNDSKRYTWEARARAIAAFAGSPGKPA